MNRPASPTALAELARLFLRLGATAFGGPAAHVALMRAEVVQRRKWLSEQQFLDLLGAANLIPGPNSTELAIHIGYQRAGAAGLAVAGASFILPAMLIVTALAWGYMRFGSLPQVGGLFYGIQPVVSAIILHALWTLGKTALKTPLTAAAGAAVFALYLLGGNELALLFGAGLLVMLITNRRRLGLGGSRPRGGLPAVLLPAGGAAFSGLAAALPYSLAVLFFTFLKIGSVLYGSGYVLLAFLRADFVQRLGWISEEQLLDAVAVGQVTPGPVFTTATFIGYLTGGLPGALAATLGIFLPAFFFVWVSSPWIPRLRSSPWAGALLDGVNAASLGLMAGVTLQLARAAIVDPLAALIALVTAGLLFSTRINPTWLIAAGGLIGVLRSLL